MTGLLAVPWILKYTLIDIAPSFFARARNRFQPHFDRTGFATLDIQKDLVQQSFKAGYHDLIIVANLSFLANLSLNGF